MKEICEELGIAYFDNREDYENWLNGRIKK